MSGFEGVGEAVTGGMVARSVEPSAGEAPAVASHPDTCLNCGTGLIGPHCHRCGQAGHVHRTLGAWWHDLAHGVLHLDGKFWHTLPLLAWRPGALTRRYIAGERARFVSPMAMFLFSVFLMFAVFSTLGGPFAVDPKATAKANEELRVERARLERRIADLERTRRTAAAAGIDAAPIDAQLADARDDLGAMRAASTVIGGSDVGFRFDRSGWPALDAAVAKAEQNPSLLLYKVQNNAYKFSWALIPLSVPFVWLLFLHRRRHRAFGVYDHTVFVTYSIAFMSLGAVGLALLRQLGFSEGAITAGMFLIPPLHMYRQLRGAYRLSRRSALWRTILLLWFSIIAATLFLLLLLMLGVLG